MVKRAGQAGGQSDRLLDQAQIISQAKGGADGESERGARKKAGRFARPCVAADFRIRAGYRIGVCSPT